MSSPEKTEASISEALEYISQNPGAKVATVARKFGLKRSRLRSRLDGHIAAAGRRAANTKLSEAEEKAICRYIDRLDAINLAVRPEFISDAADHLLRARTSKSEVAPSVGPNWATRFIKRHKYDKRPQKVLDSNRQVAEDIERVTTWFGLLQQQIQAIGATPSEIWNMDETGFRLGEGKKQIIVTKRRRTHYFGLPENRESATAIEAISATGEYLPAYIVLAGQNHQSRWYQQPELHNDTVIETSPTGYTNDQISFRWLQHFEEYSKAKSYGGWRLLILDGHGSHHTIEFIQFCEDHNIIPFGLPPHTTHLLQPLDVSVFQPLKHYQAKALDAIVRDGVTEITKLEFLGYIQQIRRQAFKKTTILSGFRRAGIWPYNPDIVLTELRLRVPIKTPSPPPGAVQHSGSSAFSTPVTVRQINKVANKIEKVLDADDDLDPSFRHDISRFLRGSLVNAAELLQTKRDLGRTRYAERIQKQRRAMKNYTLQSGGRLQVGDGRKMVVQRQEDEVAKARRVVEAAELKYRNALKRCYFEAAKKARLWRTSGILQLASVYETGFPCRLLKRF